MIEQRRLLLDATTTKAIARVEVPKDEWRNLASMFYIDPASLITLTPVAVQQLELLLNADFSHYVRPSAPTRRAGAE